MLSERVTQLLTGYVDGGLAPAERREADRVLRESEEARRLLRELQADAQALRSLSHIGPGDDFAERVLRAASEQRARPLPSRTPSAGRWALPGAAAAALLLAAGLSVRFWPDRGQKPDGAPVAEQLVGATRLEERAEPRIAMGPPQTPAAKEIATNSPGFQLDATDKTSSSLTSKTAPAPPADARPTDGKRQDLGKKDGEALPPTTPASARDPAALQLALADLAGADGRARLVTALRRQGGGCVELCSGEHTRVFEQLRVALTARGFEVGATGHARRAALRPQAGYVIYTESVTAEEVTAILTRLGVADRAQSQTSQGADAPGRLTLTALSPAARAQLRAVASQDEVRPHARRASPARDVDQEDRPADEARASGRAGGGAERLPMAAPFRRRAVVLPGTPAEAASAPTRIATPEAEKQQAAGQPLPVLWVVRGSGPVPAKAKDQK